MVASSAEQTDEPDPGLVGALRDAGCVFAEEEASLLSAEASDPVALEQLLARRIAGEPLEQVLGWAAFCGLRIRVARGVFVPRRRTEVLVGLAQELLAESGRLAVVVDLCCGSGAIGVALAAGEPDIELHAADIDPAAVACARLNVSMGRVHEGDLFDALPGDLRGRVDLVVVNAPYVPTEEIGLMPQEARLHEHRVALDGGGDGLDLHRRVAAAAPRWLAPGGSLLIETSPRQAAGTAHAFSAVGLGTQVIGPDEHGMTVVRAISDPGGSSGTMTR